MYFSDVRDFSRQFWIYTILALTLSLECNPRIRSGSTVFGSVTGISSLWSQSHAQLFCNKGANDAQNYCQFLKKCISHKNTALLVDNNSQVFFASCLTQLRKNLALLRQHGKTQETGSIGLDRKLVKFGRTSVFMKTGTQFWMKKSIVACSS